MHECMVLPGYHGLTTSLMKNSIHSRSHQSNQLQKMCSTLYQHKLKKDGKVYIF